ncbi:MULTISPECIES: LuxR C-terminal-related transcriptional regulator [unclassified Streptomyces]|uniref:LuxR C-terminal-related transcriptional regulator n=1 Tax=unclassified Streptomyces TaxID=2593676 RepID=UPI00403C210D
MTALAPTQTLTPSEQRIAQHVINGLNARGIAAATRLKPNTVNSMLRTVRWKLACPERCSLAVVAHRLLDSGQFTAPTSQRPTPDLSPEQIRLLTAAAEHTPPRDIAHAANLAPADLRDALDQLLTDAGAQDITELVVLAHSWKLLPTEQAAHATRIGAPQ